MPIQHLQSPAVGRFDPTKPVQTRSGKPARILATDIQNDYPIVAAVMESEKEYVYRYSPSGSFTGKPWPGQHDLINIPQRIKGEFWVVVYDDGMSGFTFATEQEAKTFTDRYKQSERMALPLKFTYDIPDGEA